MDKDTWIKKHRGMKQYQGLSDEEMDKLATQKVQEDELLEDFVGLNPAEKKKAIQLYSQYVKEHSFESLAEKSTLSTLVYLEILADRIKAFLDKEDNAGNRAIPGNMTQQLIDNTNQIMELKEKLGMLRDVDSESALELMNELKEKALAYYEENAGETYVKCPECQSLFRLLMKVDGLEVAKATFFRGTTLYNQKLMELYHYKKLTLEECADIMGVHSNYITFIYNNLYLKRQNDTQN